MKKVIRKSLKISGKQRRTEDFNVQLYSHDRNNVGFEFVVKDEESLENYTAKLLFKFVDSRAFWETEGNITGNTISVRFDTLLITRCEEVEGYLYLDSEENDVDVYKFKFNVVLSEVDKAHVEVKEFRYVKDNVVVDILTREEFEERLSNIHGISTDGLLTEEKAEQTYVKKEELANSQPKVDTSKLVTKEELAEKNYLTEHQDISHLATTEELNRVRESMPTAYNDKSLVDRVSKLEQKEDNDTVFDDSNIQERLNALESKPNIDISHLATKEEVKDVKSSVEVLDSISIKKSELSKKLDKDEFVTFKDGLNLSEYATKEELKNISLTPGAKGEQGIQGERGEQGLPGADGREGKSAYELAKEHGYVGDEADWIRSLKGERGDRGLQGLPGRDGKNGEQGLPGRDGRDGERGLQGLPGKDGRDGQPGEKGEQGERGLPGAKGDPGVGIPQTISLSGNMLSLSDNGGSVELPTTDLQPLTNRVRTLESKPNPTLSLNGDLLSISGGNNVKLNLTPYEIHGRGMPNNNVVANVGTTYVDEAVTNGALKWIKMHGNGTNTGWEVLIGDTGWRNVPILSKLGNSFLKVRRVNKTVSYWFGGLEWGWFGIVRRGGDGYAEHPSEKQRRLRITLGGGLPKGFRTLTSQVGSIFNDNGKIYGAWILGGSNDGDQLSFAFNDPVPTDKDIRDIRVSSISYLTDEEWPTTLP